MVSVGSVETLIMCMHIYYPVELVPGDPVRSYRGNLKNMCVCVCVCVYCAVVLVPSDPLRGDVPCRLVAVRGTPTRKCARTSFFS